MSLFDKYNLISVDVDLGWDQGDWRLVLWHGSPFCNLMSLVSFQLKIPNFKFLTSELIISVIPKLLFYMQDTHETEAQSLAGNATLFSMKMVHFTWISFTLNIKLYSYYFIDWKPFSERGVFVQLAVEKG